MKRVRQRKYWFLDHAHKSVRCYIYLLADQDGGEGKRVRRFMCSFSEAGMDAAGNFPKGQRERGEAALLDRYMDVRAAVLVGEKTRKIDGEKIGTLFDEYHRGLEGTHSKITLRAIRNAFIKYLAACGNHPINKIRKGHLIKFHQYLERRGLAKATVSTDLGLLKTFLKSLYDDERLDRIPAFPKIRVPKKLPRHLSDDELILLRDHILAKWSAAKSQDRKRLFWSHYKAMMLLAGTGFRRGELLHLRWQDINLIDQQITVRMQTTWAVKERKEKTIPIQPDLLDFLTAERSAHPNDFWFMDDGEGNQIFKSAGSLTAIFGNHLKAIGLGDRKIKAVHGFRSMFITTCYDKLGLDLGTIQNLAGHSNLQVTVGYISKSDSRQREAIKRFQPIETGIGQILSDATKLSPQTRLN